MVSFKRQRGYGVAPECFGWIEAEKPVDAGQQHFHSIGGAVFAAIHQSALPGQGTLPVCLGLLRENPNRLVSLWDIVNLFDCARLQIVLHQLHLVREMLDPHDDRSAAAMEEWVREQSRLRGEPEVPEDVRQKIEELRNLEAILNQPVKEVIEELRQFCEASSLEDTLYKIRFAGHHLKSEPSRAELRSELRHLEESLLLDLGKRTFVRVEPGAVDLVDQDRLFGDDVNQAFPNAAKDIREAGNCLAVECATAAVFHLMRASEFALRAVARDRDVEFKDKPLDEKEWGQILGALDGKLNELRGSAHNLWRNHEAREPQVRFYSEVVQELRGFNDAWRKHASHADALAFYEPEDAAGILKHVKKFMSKLSKKISETSVTEKYWTTP